MTAPGVHPPGLGPGAASKRAPGSSSPSSVVEGSAPVDAGAGRFLRMVPPMSTIGALTAVTLALHFRDPHQGGWGLCPSAAVGIYCPGCGGLRAVNDLTNGEIASALSSNILVAVLAPFVGGWLLLWTLDSWRGKRRQLDGALATKFALGFCALMLLFAVVRNLPFGAWLAP